MGHVKSLIAVFYWFLPLLAPAAELPIYIEDSHAGSFGFFAQELDLEKSYTLVLFDAHSDASGVVSSDHVRNALRKVTSKSQRRQNITNLRNDGTIQPFNWIEPLMPKPITKVIWIAGESLTDDQILEKQKEARIHLDWHTQAEKRVSGDLADQYTVTDWKRFKKLKSQKKLGSIIVSIDLDYFIDITHPTQNLTQKWQEILSWEKLEAVSFALSMPWQREKRIANQLLESAFSNALSVKNSRILFEPFLTDINDRSEMAKSYYKQGKKPPRYNIQQATKSLSDLLHRNQQRISVSHNPLAWEKLLRTWEKSQNTALLQIPSAQKSADDVWRIHHSEIDDIWIRDQTRKVKKVRWWQHKPDRKSYNIIPRSGLGKGFAENAPAYITSSRQFIKETQDLALSSNTWRQFLATEKEIGIVRIQAELVTEKGSEFSEVIEIRVYRKQDYLGALEEQFGSPYVFGIGSMHRGQESGPETLLGNDCANFLVYAWRRNGKRIPWCNPTQIKKYLEPIQHQITPLAIKEGVIIHLGSHVAALYEDRGEIGKIDNPDLLIHHLSGLPELITLEDLAKGKPYQVMKFKSSPTTANIVIGGDICLHGETPPLADSIIQQIDQADASIANLECVISANAKPLKTKPFNYIIPPEKASIIKKFTAVSLANNHAGDGGEKGLIDTMQWLNKKEITHFGSGTTPQATAVKIIHLNDQKVGLLGINSIETDILPSTATTIGSSTFPQNKKQILEGIHQARNAGVTTIIAMPHWGDEYTTKVNDQQRTIAKWLIQNGVDAVVGAHPHILQHSEYYQGKLIFYSLGNLIFSHQKRSGFNSQSLLKLSLTKEGEISQKTILTEPKNETP